MGRSCGNCASCSPWPKSRTRFEHRICWNFDLPPYLPGRGCLGVGGKTSRWAASRRILLAMVENLQKISFCSQNRILKFRQRTKGHSQMTVSLQLRFREWDKNSTYEEPILTISPCSGHNWVKNRPYGSLKTAVPNYQVTVPLSTRKNQTCPTLAKTCHFRTDLNVCCRKGNSADIDVGEHHWRLERKMSFRLM